MTQPGDRRRTPVVMEVDRNFDDLAPRFARNIYGGLKGAIRLAVIEKDFAQLYPNANVTAGSKPLRIIDAGGGQGQFSLQMAALGHHVTHCDISEQMLQLAQEHALARGVESIDFVHAPISALAHEVKQGTRLPFDLVICHSVIEWVVEQEALLADLQRLLNPQGMLSLTFYNRHGLVFKNLLRGKRSAILDDQFKPRPGSLTPHRPLAPEQVLQWLQACDWQILCHSGIRVFHDYLLTEDGRRMPAEDLMALELELSRQEPYRSMGRYQHVMARRLCPSVQTE